MQQDSFNVAFVDSLNFSLIIACYLLRAVCVCVCACAPCFNYSTSSLRVMSDYDHVSCLQNSLRFNITLTNELTGERDDYPTKYANI
jgi:hypothetical protein